MDSTRTDLEPKTPEPWRKVKERRSDSRFRCWGTAGIRVLPEGVQFMGYLIDLALGGCYIEADTAIPARIHDSVEVLLHVDGFTLRLAGVIRHIEKKTRAGIRFTDPSLRKVEQIHQLMGVLIAAEKERQAGVEKLGG